MSGVSLKRESVTVQGFTMERSPITPRTVNQARVDTGKLGAAEFPSQPVGSIDHFTNDVTKRNAIAEI